MSKGQVGHDHLNEHERRLLCCSTSVLGAVRGNMTGDGAARVTWEALRNSVRRQVRREGRAALAGTVDIKRPLPVGGRRGARTPVCGGGGSSRDNGRAGRGGERGQAGRGGGRRVQGKGVAVTSMTAVKQSWVPTSRRGQRFLSGGLAPGRAGRQHTERAPTPPPAAQRPTQTRNSNLGTAQSGDARPSFDRFSSDTQRQNAMRETRRPGGAQASTRAARSNSGRLPHYTWRIPAFTPDGRAPVVNLTWKMSRKNFTSGAGKEASAPACRPGGMGRRLPDRDGHALLHDEDEGSLEGYATTVAT